MTLKSERELVNTREKLAHLEARYKELLDDSTMNARVRDLTMHSIKRLINQLKEEIAVFEAHRLAKR
jgi:flagellar biosynthesis chaperone FliJ